MTKKGLTGMKYTPNGNNIKITSHFQIDFSNEHKFMIWLTLTELKVNKINVNITTEHPALSNGMLNYQRAFHQLKASNLLTASKTVSPFLAKHVIRTLLGWNLLKYKTQSRWISAHLMLQTKKVQTKTKRVRVM